MVPVALKLSPLQRWETCRKDDHLSSTPSISPSCHRGWTIMATLEERANDSPLGVCQMAFKGPTRAWENRAAMTQQKAKEILEWLHHGKWSHECEHLCMSYALRALTRRTISTMQVILFDCVSWEWSNTHSWRTYCPHLLHIYRLPRFMSSTEKMKRPTSKKGLGWGWCVFMCVQVELCVSAAEG